MKKKFLAASVAMALVFSLCACGAKAEDTEAEAPTTEAATEASSGDSATAGDGLKTSLFTVTYDDSVWSYEEDDLYDEEEQSSVTLKISDGDEDKVNVYISARIGDPYGFRDSLYSDGFDEKEYDEGGYDRINIGGAEFLKYEKSESSVEYIARNEGANESFEIEVNGEVSDPAVQTLLDGITYNINDIGNEDGPWYWEGTPFTATASDATVGSVTVTASPLLMDEPLITHDTFDHQIGVVGDKVYLLNKTTLREYSISGDTLKFSNEYDLGAEYSNMDVSDNGSLYLSSFSAPFIEWKDGAVANTFDNQDIDYVAMNPAGTMGISYFTSGEECFKVEIADGTATTTAISFPEVDIISNITVSNDHIFVCGSPKDSDDGHTVFVYDTAGTFQQALHADGESVGLGSVTFMTESDSTFMAMDGNMRTVTFWNKDGSYIGRIEDSELFGTNYPWFADSCVTSDGTVYTVMTEEREDKSADEAVVFTIKGY